MQGTKKLGNAWGFQTTALHSSNPAAFLYSLGRSPGEILSQQRTSPLFYIGLGRENEQIICYRYPNYEAPVPPACRTQHLALDQSITLLRWEQMQFCTLAVVENMVSLGQSLIKSILKHLRLEH